MNQFQYLRGYRDTSYVRQPFEVVRQFDPSLSKVKIICLREFEELSVAEICRYVYFLDLLEVLLDGVNLCIFKFTDVVPSVEEQSDCGFLF